MVAAEERSPRPWEVVERRVVLDRSPYGIVFEEDLRLPDGRFIPNFMRFELRPFVVVFAVVNTASGPEVPLVEQYRIGPRAVSLELPSGFIEDGEEPLAAAKRELLEEICVKAECWTFLGKFFMDANREAGWAYVFLATDACTAEQTTDHGDLGDLVIRLMPLDQVRQAWRNGGMNAAVAVLSTGLALSALDNR